MNIFDLIMQIMKQIANLCTTIYNVMYTELNIGTYTFTMWQVLGGGLLGVLLVAVLVKAIIPVA